ncbi:carbohydrate ABC transporter permease [Alicyclobacillus acidiphilus]|uniref:carbohydrate ABC transporter permease n=1 Tax=Alicyclobacillus acidiphilus TaxID=182455 RepID=UPI0008350120|nr:carbohydrate ABC transporter permease [Alicyclobacillus acidiphilus]
MTQSKTLVRIRFAGIVILGLIIIIPFLYMVIMSLTPDSEVGDGTLFPSHWAWGNYVTMWSNIGLGQYLMNSVIISAATGFLATVVAFGAAYVISRFQFRGRKVFLYSLITMQTVPQVMMLLPLFIVIVFIQQAFGIRLVGQYYTIVITYLTFALPFACWLLISYFENIPIDLEEAAQVDGATRLQLLFRVVLPLMLPGMVVAFVFSFLLSWGDVLFASVLTSNTTRTIGVGLQAFLSAGDAGGGVYWGQLMAASLTSGIPIVVIFLLLQRYILGGLTSGAVKS